MWFIWNNLIISPIMSYTAGIVCKVSVVVQTSKQSVMKFAKEFGKKIRKEL